jgi:peptide/nickel transport system substrate-binding protein
MKKNRLFIFLLVLLLSAGLMTSCGGGGSDQAAGDGPVIFRIGNTDDIDTLNPLSSELMVGFEAFLLLYDPLVRYDEKYEPEPCLAESWTTSDDGLTWTFALRDGVTWHDGEPFTSADVKFTYDMMIENEQGYMYNSYLSGITGVECPDEKTVVITTDAPKANMLMNTTPILPEHIWGDIAPEELGIFANETPIGTGPFKFDSHSTGVLKLVRNPDYFGTVPTIDECIFVYYSNADTLAQALSLGEIDAAFNLGVSQKDQLENDPNITLISGQIPGFCEIAINVWDDPASGGNPLLKDKAIRQAMEYATDKKTIIDMAFGGEGEEGTTLINAGMDYHYEPTAGEKRSYDPAKAAALLDSAGYRDANGDGIREDAAGHKLEFRLVTRAEKAEDAKASQIFISNCKNAGISIINETMDDGALTDAIYAGTFDMFIWGWGADIDPSVILAVLTTDNIGNLSDTYFSNERYDQLFKEQMYMLDEAERQAAVFEMQKIAYEEAPYILLIYDNNLQAIRSDKWTGFTQFPNDMGLFFKGLTNYNYINIKPVAAE